jgi:hypothetical protein
MVENGPSKMGFSAYGPSGDKEGRCDVHTGG